MPRTLSILLLIPGLGLSTVAVAEPVNPFARPVLEDRPASVESETVSIARPELRGVVVAGANSIANLSGTLLAIGEEASGYQLEDVTEKDATFRYQGALVTLELVEQPADRP